MKINVLLALAAVAAGIALCLLFGEDRLVIAEPETAPVVDNAADPAWEAPLADLVDTLPPEPAKPKADIVVRVKLPPTPDANYCPSDPNHIPMCDPDRPIIPLEEKGQS